MLYPLFGVYHDQSVEEAALSVLRSGQIASGAHVEQFRRAFADQVGRPLTVTVNDMSNAVAIALRLAGVEPGTEIITQAFSCLSSNAPLGLSGAKVRWADMNPDTATVSVDSVEALMTPSTRAVLLYHVAGYPGPAQEIAALCRSRGVALIEDCNNALGATLGGVQLGQFGDYAIHSFYPNRQINAIEGGALSVSTDAEFQRALKLRKYGIDPLRFRNSEGEIDPDVDVPELGWAAILNNLSSAVGLAQMSGLSARLAATRLNALHLRDLLNGVPGLQIVQPLAGADPAWWAVLVLAENRDRLLTQLKRRGVAASRLHFRNDAYSGFKARRAPLPGTDRFMAEVVALPCGWWLSPDDIDAISQEVRTALAVMA